MTTGSSGCTAGGERTRIDVYDSDDQMAGVQQLLSQFDESAGHQPGLDELPFVCGDLFSGGLESNDQRDVVIDASLAAGVGRSTCSSWPPGGSRPNVVARRSIARGVPAVSATDGPRPWPGLSTPA